ncbi:MAG TPA: glycoside hydrolase family 88 protein [Anaerolineales bacterium]|nr:glycoside hydrolase family 88 protein [Anaerolineales bacterium]
MKQLSPQNPTALKPWSVRMVESILQRYTLDEALWHYEHGLQVMAIQKSAEATGEARYMGFVLDWINRFVQADGSIRTYRMDEYNLDQINAGKLLFGALDRTGDKRYRKALHLLREQLETQPRTKSNGFWHKKIYPYQMWLDGIYMAGPFLAEYARRFNEPESFDDVVHQILLIEEHTRDEKTGLLYHGWDESKQQRWCDSATGHSPHFWGRAVGWYMMALVDVLDHLPLEQARRQDVIAILARTARALVRVQDEATGLWYQILDLPERAGNYLEASASTMFVYAFAKGVRKGYLPPDFLFSARRGYQGLLQNLIRIDAQGLLTLEKVCGVGGLGGEPYRDGSFEYYISEKTIPNDPKGVGPFILAALEIERAGLNGGLVE